MYVLSFSTKLLVMTNNCRFHGKHYHGFLLILLEAKLYQHQFPFCRLYHHYNILHNFYSILCNLKKPFLPLKGKKKQLTKPM